MLEDKERLKNLESYSVIDSLPEEEFDNLARIASEICETPVSYVSFLDDKRQWYKSRFGMEIIETRLDDAICAYTVENCKKLIVVPDMRVDNRFKDNRYVQNDPKVVFYAGIPLISQEGYSLGTMCVLDFKPRNLSYKQEQSLIALGKQIMVVLELRRKELILIQKAKTLEEFQTRAKQEVENASKNIYLLTKILKNYNKDFNEKSQIVLDLIKESTNDLKKLIEELE